MKEAFVKNNIIDLFHYSCRAASTSKAKSVEVDIHNIITILTILFKSYDKK